MQRTLRSLPSTGFSLCLLPRPTGPANDVVLPIAAEDEKPPKLMLTVALEDMTPSRDCVSIFILGWFMNDSIIYNQQSI